MTLTPEQLDKSRKEFDMAIDQYNAGDIINVPANIKSEDEFFNWLQSADINYRERE